MAYSPITKSSSFFNTKLYSGNGSTNSITGVGFQPDWTWIKTRNLDGYNHNVYDAVRGVTKLLKPSGDKAEITSATSLTAFDSDGFSFGGTGTGEINQSNGTYASWNWKANGQGSSNTDGTINSTYTSANTTSGCSIVTYTGNGTAGATVGHGLGVVPKLMIVKSRSTAGENWIVYHASLGATKYMVLASTTAPVTSAGAWNNTAPTSTVFSLTDSGGDTNRTGETYVAYCFAEVQGYSAFGQYRGNAVATDGTFVNCGFKPSLVIQKRTDGAEPWFMFDDKRQGYNSENEYLLSNSTDAEGTSNRIDLLSNGFKLMTTDGGNNANGGPYIYMAWGQTLVGSNNVPNNAR